MAVVEILGSNMDPVFKSLGVNYKKTYCRNASFRNQDDYCEVYEIAQSDMNSLGKEFYNGETGAWYHWCKGSNMGTAYEFFEINGRELIGWAGSHREYLRDCWDDFDSETKAKYHYSFKEYENSAKPRKYDTLLDYIHDELCIFINRQVCALAVDLARANGMTMAKLFETYEG